VTEPRRIQRQRTKGYRLPPDAIYVGRPSRWGNPYRIGWHYQHLGFVADEARAVEVFRERLAGLAPLGWFAPLRGHDLACWCPLCDAHRDGLPLGVVCPDCAPCHGDVLLSLANQ
jgi:hypothetical protein